MKIEVTATGQLKKYMPENKIIDVPEGISLNELKTICGMDSSVTNGYLLNGKIGRGSNLLENGDVVKFLMLVGAG